VDQNGSDDIASRLPTPLDMIKYTKMPTRAAGFAYALVESVPSSLSLLFPCIYMAVIPAAISAADAGSLRYSSIFNRQVF
jgi:hypothetical protein